ncbi:hypothetical protein RB653_003761 [Dictyostelium firmibasis]|uniref:Uncharacterized protein n=1 Tax=Dictyostelium firmibasis TaxID=79012 RepID=A0AAN7U8L0_9MYCE
MRKLLLLLSILLFINIIYCQQFSDQYTINYLKNEENKYNNAWSNIKINDLFNLFCIKYGYLTHYELLYTKTVGYFLQIRNNMKKYTFSNRLDYELDSMKNYSVFGSNSSPVPDAVVDICQDHYEDIRIPTLTYLKLQGIIVKEYSLSNNLSISENTKQNSRTVYYQLLTRIERAFDIISKPSRLQWTGQLFVENAFYYLATIFEGLYNGFDMGLLNGLVHGNEYNDEINYLGSLDERADELGLDVLNKYAYMQNAIITNQRSLCLLGLVCVYPSVYNLPNWNRLISIFWYSNDYYYSKPMYFISDLPTGHNNLSSSLSLDLNKYYDSIYVIDWFLMGKSVTSKPFTYVPDPYILTGQVADFMTGLRGYSFTWKGAGVLNPLSGSAAFFTNIKFSTNETNQHVVFSINFGDGHGSGENLALNQNANKFQLNFYEKNPTTNQYTIVGNISTTYSLNQRNEIIQNNFLFIRTISSRFDFIGGRYTLITNPVTFNSKEIKVEFIPIYPFDILLLSLEIETSYNYDD